MKPFTFRQMGQNKLKYSHLAIFLIFGSCMQAATLQDLQSNLSNLQQQQAKANTELQNTLDKQKQEQAILDKTLKEQEQERAMLDNKLKEQQKQYNEKQAELEAQKQAHQKEEAMLGNKLDQQQKQDDEKQKQIDQFIRDAAKLWEQNVHKTGTSSDEIQKKINENTEKINQTKKE